jgi:hypothetical protein
MTPWNRPEPDPVPNVAVAARTAVRDIDRSNAREDAQLVEAFLWAAWPTLQAQNQ